MRRVALIAGLGLWSVGCGFGDSPTDPPTDSPETIVVVQGVIRADQAQQWILVERTFNGTIAEIATGLIPGSGVAVPVESANVTLSNVSFPADPCGPNVPLIESAGPLQQIQPGVYWGPVGCPTIRAGDTLDLVIVAGTERVTARTIVPGVNGMALEAGGVSVAVPGPTLEFNRDADTLMATVDPNGGRALVVEIREQAVAESLAQIASASSFFWADATELTLPGDLLDIFQDFDDLEDGDPQSLFSAGRIHSATIAYADQNFYDHLRSFNLAISGRGFINSIEGGWGFFGSMTAAETQLRVIGDIDDPREGFYRATGTISGVAVVLDVELYLNRVIGGTEAEFSMLLKGEWVLGPYDSWAGGRISGTTLEATIEQATGGITTEGLAEVRRWDLTGEFNHTGVSLLAVRVGEFDHGTLTLTRQ